MKYTILELKKLNLPLNEVTEFDFSEELNGFEDILSSSKATVEETLTKLNDDYFHLKAHIKIDLVLESAITLEKVPYAIDTILNVDYTTLQNVTDEDAIIVENNTIDTYDAILTEILCQKPMTAKNPGEEFESDLEEEEDKINPAFASLADFLK